VHSANKYILLSFNSHSKLLIHPRPGEQVRLALVRVAWSLARFYPSLNFIISFSIEYEGIPILVTHSMVSS
jgi:hypothetical protein